MKLFRRLLLLMLLFVGMGIGGLLLVRLLFPPEKVRAVLIAQLEKNLGRPVSIQRVRLRPFSGFVAEGIAIGRWKNKEETALRVEQIALRYRWRALLHRRLEIVQIELRKPELRYVATEAIPQDPSGLSQSDANTNMPLSFYVRSVELKSASLEVLSRLSDSTLVRLWIRPIDLFLKDLKLGNGPLRMETISARATLRFPETAVIVEENPKNGVQADSMGTQVEFQVSGRVKARLQTEDSLSAFPLQVRGKLQLIPSGEMVRGRALPRQIRERPLQVSFNLQSHIGEAIGKGNLSLRVPEVGFFNLPFSFHGRGKAFAVSVSADSAWMDPLILVSPLQAGGGMFFIRGRGRIQVDTLEVKAELSGQKSTFRYRFACRWGPVDTLALPQWAGKGLYGTVRARGWVENGQILAGKITLSADVDSGVVAEEAAGVPLPVQDVHLVGNVQLGRNGVPEQVDVEVRGKQLLGVPFRLLGSFSIEGVDRLQDLSWKHVRGISEIVVQPVPLERFGVQTATGNLSAELVLSTELGKDVDFSLDGHVNNLAVEYDTIGGFQLLPDVDLSFIGTVDGYPGRGQFLLRDGELNIGPFFDGFMSARLDALSGEMQIGLDSLHLNLVELGDYLPLDIQEGLRRSLWKSESVVVGDMEIWFAGDSLFSQIRGDLHLLVPYFRSRYWGIRLDSLEIAGVFGGTFETLQFDLDGTLAAFEVPGVTTVAKSTVLEAELLMQDLDRLNVLRLVMKQPEWHTQLQITGTLDRLSEGPFYALYGMFHFSSTDPVELLRVTKVQGNVQGSFSALSLGDDPDRLQLDFWLTVDSLDAESDAGFRLYGLRGSGAVHQLYNLESGLLESPFHREEAPALLLAADPGMAFLPLFQTGECDTFRVDSLDVGEYRVENVLLCLRYDAGLLEVRELYGELYGGNFLFNGWLWLNTGLLPDMEYAVRGQVSGVNSAAFPYVQGEGFSPFGMSLWIRGKGLHLASEIDLRGQIEISEISARTADHFLQSISTGRADKGIQALRFLLRRGYRPTRFSLTIRDGNLYPVIEMSQPWYWPVRIAGSRVALSRLPLRSLLYFFTPPSGF